MKQTSRMREETKLETSARDSYQCQWSMVPNFEVSRNYHKSEIVYDTDNFVGNNNWKVTTKSWK